MQDCDPSSSFQWQVSNSAEPWEGLYGWPPDPMWTESNWPSGQPALELFQVILDPISEYSNQSALSVLHVYQIDGLCFRNREESSNPIPLPSKSARLLSLAFSRQLAAIMCNI